MWSQAVLFIRKEPPSPYGSKRSNVCVTQNSKTGFALFFPEAITCSSKLIWSSADCRHFFCWSQVIELSTVPSSFRKNVQLSVLIYTLRLASPSVSFPTLLALVLLPVCLCRIVQIFSLLQTPIAFRGIFLIISTRHLNSKFSGTNLWFTCILCVSAHVFLYNYLHMVVLMFSFLKTSWDGFRMRDEI